MTVKIQCPCGTKIAFDVEPENGRMPVSVACPSCGTDVTPLADAFLAQPTPTPATAAPVRINLRVASDIPAPPTVQPAAPSGRAAFIERTQAVAQSRVPVGDDIVTAKDVEELNRWRGPVKIALVGVALLLGVWVWYAFFGSKPQVAFELSASKQDPFRWGQPLGRDRVFALRADKASVYEVKSGNEIWTSAFAPNERPGHSDAALWSEPIEPLVLVVGDGIWIALANKLVRLESSTGRRLAEVPLPERLESLEASENVAVAVAASTPAQRIVTRIDLLTGKSASETHTTPALPATGGRNLPAERGAVETTFIPSGSQVAALSIRLLEQRIITRDGPTTESRQERDNKPLIERENLRAADSTEAVRQFLNAGKGGPVEYDESRYQVMLQRLFGVATPWSAEVIGVPTFYSAGGMDLLVSGTDVRAFDSANRLLWTAKLSYPLAMQRRAGGLQPVVSVGPRLYVFDLGTLTAFEARSGQVAWRLPSVGISQAVPAGDAMYVSTTSAGPDAIRPMGDLKDTDRAYPILLKVEAATGRVLWQLERLADRAWPAGKFLYVSRTAASALNELQASMNRTDAASMFHLRRLDPQTGKPLWDWHQPGGPTRVMARENEVTLSGATSLTVLRYLAW